MESREYLDSQDKSIDRIKSLAGRIVEHKVNRLFADISGLSSEENDMSLTDMQRSDRFWDRYNKGARKFRKAFLGWGRLETYKSLDEVARVLEKLGMANSSEDGIKLAHYFLEKRYNIGGQNLENGLMFFEDRDGYGNLVFRIRGSK